MTTSSATSPAGPALLIVAVTTARPPATAGPAAKPARLASGAARGAAVTVTVPLATTEPSGAMAEATITWGPARPARSRLRVMTAHWQGATASGLLALSAPARLRLPRQTP